MVFQGILPAGSVVMLKEGNHRLMVTGYAQKLQGSDEVYDYVGCLWPEGFTAPDQNIVFNQDAVETVYFIGYQTDGQQVFAAKLQDALAEYRARQKE